MIGVMPVLFDPDKQEAPHTIVGSQVACQEYVRAMLLYLPNAVTMFVPEASITSAKADVKRFGENAAIDLSEPGVYGLSHIPSLIQRKAVSVLHDVTGPFLQRLSYVRSQCATQPFPVTGLIHGISYNIALWDYFTRMLLASTLPCDAVICTSTAARDACIHLLKRTEDGLRTVGRCSAESNVRLHVIPLGVDTDLYRPRDRQDCRRQLGLPQNKTLLLYFGRIDSVTKADLHPLLMTFAELIRKHGDTLTLVLAGNTDQSMIEPLYGVIGRLGCARQVLIRKQPGIIEAPLYYGASDMFVSPVETLQESFGITPLEAMASSLPVVVSGPLSNPKTVS